MKARSALMAIVGLTLSGPLAQAQVAPEVFRNKTFVYAFSENEKARFDDSGENANFVISRQITLFVSSAGRLFNRAEVNARNLDMQIVRGGRGGRGGGRGMEGISETAPDASSSNIRALSSGMTVRKREFVGTKMRFLTQFSGVSRLVEVDLSGSSCTVNARYGRESSGAMKRHTLGGRPYTILSQSISGERCSVREGNHL